MYKKAAVLISFLALAIFASASHYYGTSDFYPEGYYQAYDYTSPHFQNEYYNLGYKNLDLSDWYVMASRPYGNYGYGYGYPSSSYSYDYSYYRNSYDPGYGYSAYAPYYGAYTVPYSAVNYAPGYYYDNANLYGGPYSYSYGQPSGRYDNSNLYSGPYN